MMTLAEATEAYQAMLEIWRRAPYDEEIEEDLDKAHAVLVNVWTVHTTGGAA